MVKPIRKMDGINGENKRNCRTLDRSQKSKSSDCLRVQTNQLQSRMKSVRCAQIAHRDHGRFKAKAKGKEIRKHPADLSAGVRRQVDLTVCMCKKTDK